MFCKGLRAGAAVLLTALILTACAGITEWIGQKPVDAQKAAESVEAREMASALSARNQNLSTFKGTGRVKLWRGGQVLTLRAAWVGSYPDKLRIAVMNAAGQLMASLSSDGRYLYMISHPEGEFYKKSSANPTLERLISIPISINDIVSILSNRLPIREYHTAELHVDGSKRGYILTLEGKRQGVIEKIYTDADKRSVLQVEIFEDSDRLLYRTVFQGRLRVDDFELPARITVSDSAENRFELDIDQFWADVPLLPSIFVLTPPAPPN